MSIMRLVLAGILACTQFFGTTNTARANGDTPEAFVLQLGDAGLRILNSAHLTKYERRREFMRLYELHFDSVGISRYVLTRTLAGASLWERKALSRLTACYVVKVVEERLQKYAGSRFTLGRVERDGGITTVSTTVPTLDGANTIRIDWILRKEGYRFLVKDVKIEGLSLVYNLRIEFESVYKQAEFTVNFFVQGLERLVGAENCDHRVILGG